MTVGDKDKDGLEVDPNALAEGDGEGQGDAESHGRDPKGRWVPKVRLDEVLADSKQTREALQREREDRIRLEERLKAVETRATPETKVYTRPELLALVREEKITQEQADTYWETQMRASIREEVNRDATAREAQRESVVDIKRDLARYKELRPEVMREGSDDRGRVATEYNYLVSRGYAANAQTELAALRSVFGAIDKLEKRQSMQQDREAFADTGNGQQRDPAPKADGDVLKNLPQRYRDHYDTMIAKGMYKDWNDPRIAKELKRVPLDVYKRREKKFAQ